MARKERIKNPNRLPFGKFMAWQARGISMGCMVIIYGYLSLFATDTLGIKAATVGTILLISKLIDGVTDFVAGYLIDNTKTKFGKARPYEFCIFGVWICTFLLFACPSDWSYTLKCVWIFLMYALNHSIFATFLYSNQTAYLLRAFPTQDQIIKVNSYGGLVVTLGCAVVSMTFPQMVAHATTSREWSTALAIFAVPLLVLGLMRFLFVKETVEVDADTKNAEKTSVREVLDMIKNNKYIWHVMLVSLLYNIVLSMNAQTYYFKYIGGGIGRITTIAAIAMPMMLVMFIFPVILKKGVRLSRLMIFGGFCGVVGYLINYFAGDNMALLLAAAVLYSFAGLPIAYLTALMILDVSEYNVLTGHKRSESMVSSLQTFGTKVGQGIGQAALGFLLAAFGYLESTGGAAVTQPASAMTGIRLIFSFIPAAVYLLIAVILFTYDLEKKLPDMRAAAAEKTAVETATE